MRLPRDISGDELARLLSAFGYVAVRQTGSHVRLSTAQCGEHHVTIPRHHPLRIGTLSGILGEIADHFHLERNDLIEKLFDR